MARSPGTHDVARACIDIGSNTTRLLVAECGAGGVRELRAERAFTRLGQGLDDGGLLTRAKLEELADTVASQVRLARELGAEPVRAVATAAVRRAANRAELLRVVREAAGVEIEVLSEDEEARLAFAGATQTLDHAPAGVVGVVDVGGGSSELVAGTVAEGVSWSASFPVGSGDLAEAYLRSDPPASSELAALRAHVVGALAGVAPPAVEHGLAVGGSATSLHRLVGDVLAPATLAKAIDVLAAAPAAEVARRFGLDVRRVRLLPAGILILEAASALFGRPLLIARGGLREGVVLELGPARAAA
jgi:exopolyphosphatase / guanosine-5'-triphosphate,3'-diphosphate pyrophosphatase